MACPGFILLGGADILFFLGGGRITPKKSFLPLRQNSEHSEFDSSPAAEQTRGGAEIESDADYALFWCYFGLIFIKFDANLALKFTKFGTNSLSNISIKKAPYFMPDKHFLN